MRHGAQFAPVTLPSARKTWPLVGTSGRDERLGAAFDADLAELEEGKVEKHRNWPVTRPQHRGNRPPFQPRIYDPQHSQAGRHLLLANIALAHHGTRRQGQIAGEQAHEEQNRGFASFG